MKKISWSDRVSDVVISGLLELEQLAILADEYVSKLYREANLVILKLWVLVLLSLKLVFHQLI